MDSPQLFVGLLGFDAQAHAEFERALQREESSSSARWISAPHAESDALILNAAHARVASDGTLRVAARAGSGSHEEFSIDLAQMPLPYAIANPPVSLATELGRMLEAGGPRRQPSFQLDAKDTRSIANALEGLENALKPVRALYALGAQIREHSRELDWMRSYHVTRKGSLLVMLDLATRVCYLREDLRPIDLDGANWERRPPGSAAATPGFLAYTIEEAAWAFAMRSEIVDLPIKWMTDRLYFRRLPYVRPDMLYPRQNLLLELLNGQPWTFQELSQVESFTVAKLTRDLYALHVVRVVTNEPAKAAAHLRDWGKAAPSVGGFQQSRPFADAQPSSQLFGASSVLDWRDVKNPLPTAPSKLI